MWNVGIFLDHQFWIGFQGRPGNNGVSRYPSYQKTFEFTENFGRNAFFCSLPFKQNCFSQGCFWDFFQFFCENVGFFCLTENFLLLLLSLHFIIQLWIRKCVNNRSLSLFLLLSCRHWWPHKSQIFFCQSVSISFC